MSDSTRCLDGATLFAQPTIIPNQGASAHPVYYGGDLCCRKVLEAAELLCWHIHIEGEERMCLEAADALAHQRCDVPVATVLAQQGACVEEASYHVIGDRDRAQRGVHGPALERGTGRRLDQQFGGAGEGGRVDAIAEDPPQRV